VQLTQRQIDLSLFTLMGVGSLVRLLAELASERSTQIVLAYSGAAALFIGLGVAYWRGWAWARITAVVAVVPLLIFGLPPENLRDDFATALFVPPVLALIFGGPRLVLLCGLALYSGVLLRAGLDSPYTDLGKLIVYSVVVGGLVLSRIAVDNAQELEQARQRATAALASAEAQRAQLSEQAQALARQNAEQQRLLDLVSTLETPTIRLADGVLLAPIIGSLDERRVQALTTRLLHAASAQRARHVVLDLAGVAMIDAAVAQALLQTAKALRLLGCHVALSGISGSVALTLTNLGLDLSELEIVRSPQDLV
jgi:anti-anti-sigma factor